MGFILPPLKGLRAVEAVGRHGTISGAANELFVTPGAVSRQVNLIEDHFGCKFFLREQGGMVLTEIGRKYLEQVTEAFQIIDAAGVHTKRQDTGRRLTIRSLGAYTTEWLLRHISEFEEMHPDLQIQIKGHKRPVNFDTDEADIGIALGSGNWTGLNSEYLFRPHLTAIASAKYMAGREINDLDDLHEYRLIQPMDIRPNWRDWLLSISPSLTFECFKSCWLETSSQMYTAVRDNVGIGLGQWHMVAQGLIDGSIVTPIKHLTPLPGAMYMIWLPKSEIAKPEILQFRDWILSGIETVEKQLEPMVSDMTVDSAFLRETDLNRIYYESILDLENMDEFT